MTELAIDKKIEQFVENLKKWEYEKWIIELLVWSALEEKVINVEHTKLNWINQFKQINDVYWEYLSFERVKTLKLGRLEKITYFIYCEIYPIQIVITDYNNWENNNIINMVFDDKVLGTLDSLN